MFLAYLGDEFLWWLIVLEYAQGRELGGNRWILRRLFNGGHQRLRHLGRHSGGGKETEPYAQQVLAVTELYYRGYLGVMREVTRENHSSPRSTLLLGAERAQRERHPLHMSAQARGDPGGPAFKRHHRQPGARERVDHLDVEMAGRSRPDSSYTELTRILFGKLYQLTEGFVGCILPNRE